MEFSGLRPDITAKQLATGLIKPQVRFALFPVKLHTGNWLWLEKYRIAPIGVYYEESHDTFYQYRVGGSSMDGSGGEYWPRRRFAMNDDSYFKVDYFKGTEEELIHRLTETAGLK